MHYTNKAFQSRFLILYFVSGSFISCIDDQIIRPHSSGSPNENIHDAFVLNIFGAKLSYFSYIDL